MRSLIFTMVVASFVGGGGSVLAQGKPAAGKARGKPAAAAPAPAGAASSAAPAADAEPKYKVERGAGGRKVIRLTDALVIQGKIQKPEAFFFYQKSNINYEWQELKQDFVPKILDSVSKAPF